MCQAISGVAVKSDDDVKVYTLRHSDSHEDLRKEYKIRDDGGAGATRQTPVELVMVSDLFKVEGMKFQFDDKRPDWWTDSMTESAIRQLHKAWMGRWVGKVLEFKGDLFLRSLTTIPEGVTIKSGGDLYLPSLTTIAKGVTIKSGGDLYLPSLTKIAKGVTIKSGGNLFLSSLTTISKGVTIKSVGDLYLRYLTTIPEGCKSIV